MCLFYVFSASIRMFFFILFLSNKCLKRVQKRLIQFIMPRFQQSHYTMEKNLCCFFSLHNVCSNVRFAPQSNGTYISHFYIFMEMIVLIFMSRTCCKRMAFIVHMFLFTRQQKWIADNNYMGCKQRWYAVCTHQIPIHLHRNCGQKCDFFCLHFALNSTRIIGGIYAIYEHKANENALCTDGVFIVCQFKMRSQRCCIYILCSALTLWIRCHIECEYFCNLDGE